MIKKYQIILFATLLSLFSCNKYDDTAVWDELNDHKERLETLEQLCSRINTDISALQTIVSALESNDYVTFVSPIEEAGNVTGYKIVFEKGGTVTLYHGADGADGVDGKQGTPGQDGKDASVPVVGVSQDSDGIYYWTVDGDWLLDKDGNKVKAVGQDGENGKDGEDGADAYVPVIDIMKDADGVFYWTLDGEWLLDKDGNKVKVVGQDGEDGKDGTDGTDGEDGKDGTDGVAPLISAAMDVDGIYYWTLNGEWLLDKNGNKIKAEGRNGADGTDGVDGKPGTPGQNGADGKNGDVPQLKIEGGYWYISYDGGSGWTKLGKADGDDGADGKGDESVFRSVTYDSDNVYFTLSDGSVITIAKKKSGEGGPIGEDISGMWAVVDSRQMCCEYIKLDDKLSLYFSDKKYLVHKKTVWRSKDTDYELHDSFPLTLNGELLYLNGQEWGEYVIQEDTLSVAGVKYLKVENFSEDFCCSVKVEGELPIVYGYPQGNKNVRCEITDFIKGPMPYLSSENEWIKELKWKDDILSFSLDENVADEDRNGNIQIDYLHAAPLNVEIIQRNSSSIVITATPDKVECDYRKSSQSFDYEIENPCEGIDAVVATDVDWLIDLKQEGNTVSFTLQENNSGSSREGYITLTYGKVVYKYPVSQSYEAPEIVFSSPSTSCDYSGGSFNLTYEVRNPREGVEAVASKEIGWITDLTCSDGKMSFVVSENNDGSPRTADITLTYGGYAFKHTITQSYEAPEIVLSSSSVSCDYNGGSFEFHYDIDNFRESISVAAQTNDLWITDIVVSSGKVSFNVVPNDKTSSRTGTIVLIYGNLATSEYSVNQSGNFTLIKDLSSVVSANCYIVSSAEVYKFRAFKGNSSMSVGTVSSVEVLWESFGTSTAPNVGDLIKDVQYKNDYIVLETAMPFREGNAVIAAKDASGKVLWSWHIWMTDKPEDQIYNNDAGTMMDRNLGATSATPGDVGALGLLYQWGRKDPFLGSSLLYPSSYYSSDMAASTGIWPDYVISDESVGTIEYTISNPMVFIARNKAVGYDWYYPVQGVMENTRWQTEKTIYDPCPAGYRVPDGDKNGVWPVAFGTEDSFEDLYFDKVNKGFDFSKTGYTLIDGLTCWYPATGSKPSWGDSSIYEPGSESDYWSCSPMSSTDSDYSRVLTFSTTEVDPYYICGRATGNPVRCLKE